MRALISSGLFCLTALFMTIQSVPSFAQPQSLRFHNSIGSNMVLPYGKPFTLSGMAEPRTALVLEADGQRYSFNSDAEGNWQTQIGPLAAGGPFRLTLSDGRQSVELDNILAGELWLCSGQSNMAYSVAASIDQPQGYNQGHDAIRLLSVPLRAELAEQKTFIDAPDWQQATDESARGFSAICYFFARKKIEADGIPLGLINASWGGSAIEAWVSEAGLMQVSGYDHKVQQLQQFRDDKRGAELSFAEDWVSWWSNASDQGPVWRDGVLNTTADWRDAPLQNWKTYPDERLANHHGILWYSIGFELTEEQSRKKASFILGKIDEVDTTWINGKFVNNTFGYGTRREYPLEADVLQAGTNQITVNVLNTWDVGGMLGPMDDVGLGFDDGEFIALGTGWKYRYIPRETGQPPRSPWESVSGVTGMFNGMIAPLAPLTIEGVLWYQGESNAESSSTYQALLTAFVSDWRAHFNNDSLPVIVIQMPNYGSVATTPVESGWATLRDAQQNVALADANVGIVVTHDVGDDIDIHPKQKFVVGERAFQVLQAIRGNGMADGIVPMLSHSGETLVLDFQPPLVGKELMEVSGFSLCTLQDCTYVHALQRGSRIEISPGALANATELRYCWSDGGHCELQGLNGLPVSSFRIDLR